MLVVLSTEQILSGCPGVTRALEPGVNTHYEVVIPPGSSCAFHRATLQPVESSRVKRGAHCSERPVPIGQREQELASERIGNLMDRALFLPWPPEGEGHFGHLITEVAGAAFCLLEDGPEVLRDVQTIILPAYASRTRLRDSVFRGRRVLTTDQLSCNLGVSKLYCVRPTMINRYGVAEAHSRSIEGLFSVTERVPSELTASSPAWVRSDMPEKVYVSRSRIGGRHRQIGDEERLQEALERSGWTILHPQEVRLEQQLQMYRNARKIAGTWGSAFHVLMYFGRLLNERCQSVHVLSPPGNLPLGSFALQFAAFGTSARFIRCLAADPTCSKSAGAKKNQLIPKHLVPDIVQELQA